MVTDYSCYNSPINTLILDLGDVVFDWTPPSDTKIKPEDFRRAMNTLFWHEFERGKISEDECLEKIVQSRKMQVSAQDLKETVRQASLSLKANEEFVSALKDLKRRYNLKVYAMSNVALPHYEILRAQPWDIWTLFDGIFTSAEVGMRKHDLGFYYHVIHESSISPESALFLDDKAENAVAAQSLGIRAVRFTKREEVTRQLYNALGNPVYRGDEYLKQQAKRMHAIINGIDVKDNFINLTIFDVTRNPDLVELVEPVAPHILWNYFGEKPTLSFIRNFPDDFDTSFLAALVVGLPEKTAHQLMDKALKNMNSDGLIMLYDDPNRPRVDQGCCAHMMAFFVRYGRENEVSRMWEWLYNILLHRAHLIGGYYYHLPDYFLWIMSRITREASKAGRSLPGKIPIADLLRRRCKERLGVTDTALALGLRLLACQAVGVPLADYRGDLERLIDMQCEDGGWPLCELYKIPLAKTAIESRGMPTALALKVLKDAAFAEC
ncbi:hypothetical protein TWF694_005127 [Orbilia ellipsospora]|uniref:Uncharacterized protein n=1 Tax=Orbilia ellipsospora TaxID=2528407 RepID=A0AAV9WW15_9PEZI